MPTDDDHDTYEDYLARQGDAGSDRLGEIRIASLTQDPGPDVAFLLDLVDQLQRDARIDAENINGLLAERELLREFLPRAIKALRPFAALKDAPSVSHISGVAVTHASRLVAEYDASKAPCYCAETSSRNCPQHQDAGR